MIFPPERRIIRPRLIIPAMPLLVYIIPKCGTIRSLIFYRTERIILIFVKVIVTYLSLFRNETMEIRVGIHFQHSLRRRRRCRQNSGTHTRRHDPPNYFPINGLLTDMAKASILDRPLRCGV